MSAFGPLLHKYSLRGSDGGDALSAMMEKQFPGHRLELPRGTKDIRGQFGFCPLTAVHLLYGRYECAFRIQVPHSRYFIQGFPIRGISEIVNNAVTTTITSLVGSLVEPGALSFSPAQNFEDFVTLIDPKALLTAVGALTGTHPVGQLRLDYKNFESRPLPRLSRNLVKLLVEELDADDSVPSPVVIAELEQAILVAFLYGNRHNYSDVLDGRPPAAAPWQIRRVEEYVEANWDQPITIEALAVVANASARSIFHSFKEHRRYSPMHFVKHVRLKHARDLLNARDGETTVTTIAFECGFGNLGHFANDYKQAFGETPSATLLRAKSGARR